MTWEELFAHWSSLVVQRSNHDAELYLRELRRRVALNTESEWRWLEAALADRERKHFVTRVFHLQPIPRRLLFAFARAAVVDSDVSSSRSYIDPCVETFGRSVVEKELEALRRSGVATDDLYEGAMYWVRSAHPFRRGTPDQTKSMP